MAHETNRQFFWTTISIAVSTRTCGYSNGKKVLCCGNGGILYREERWLIGKVAERLVAGLGKICLYVKTHTH